MNKVSVFEKGISQALRKEPSIKWLYIILGVGIGWAFQYEKNLQERRDLILPLVLVFVVELINTAIETVVNRISLKKHFLSGYAKDLASSATWVVALYTAWVWGKWIYYNWDIFPEALGWGVLWGALTLPLAFIFRWLWKRSR